LWLIKIPFSIIPISNSWFNWFRFFSDLKSIRFSVEIKNKDPNTRTFIYSIFPTSKSISIGKQVKEYSILADLTTELLVSSFPIKLPSFGFKYKVVRKEEYGLKVPKVSSGHNGNTEAEWKFFLKNFEGEGQYRVDIIAAFPNSISSGYNLRMKASAETNLPLRITEVDHTASLQLKNE
jgi:hypothetical protein